MMSLLVQIYFVSSYHAFFIHLMLFFTDRSSLMFYPMISLSGSSAVENQEVNTQS